MPLKVTLGEHGQINALLVGPCQITQDGLADPDRIVEDRKALKSGDSHGSRVARGGAKFNKKQGVVAEVVPDIAQEAAQRGRPKTCQ
jgi:hypothetical protein